MPICSEPPKRFNKLASIVTTSPLRVMTLKSHPLPPLPPCDLFQTVNVPPYIQDAS